MNKKYLLELRKFEALNCWINFIETNLSLQMEFSQKEDKWNYVYNDFVLEISNKSFVESNVKQNADIIFYVDFKENSLQIKNAECFTKSGILLGRVNDVFLDEQNKLATEKEREIIFKHTEPLSKQAQTFKNDFKF